VATRKEKKAGDVVGAAVARSVERLTAAEPQVRSGDDAEAVHQARVATRRLRSDLRTFAPLVRAGWRRPVRSELRWLADALGAVRDADVLLDRLRRGVERLAPDDRGPAASIIGRLERERDIHRTALLEVLDSERHAELQATLAAASSQLPLTGPAGKRADRALPRLVVKPWRELVDEVRHAVDAGSDDGLHLVRIRAKRCRYAAEAVAPVVGPRATRFADAVSDLQTVLGDLHDAVVAAAWLRSLADLSERDAIVAGELVDMQRRDADASRAGWPAAWERASRRKLRRWLPRAR
jgi:CHAD domain-containing protein